MYKTNIITQQCHTEILQTKKNNYFRKRLRHIFILGHNYMNLKQL